MRIKSFVNGALEYSELTTAISLRNNSMVWRILILRCACKNVVHETTVCLKQLNDGIIQT
jgi:hypothetical protein